MRCQDWAALLTRCACRQHDRVEIIASETVRAHSFRLSGKGTLRTRLARRVERREAVSLLAP